MSRTRMLSQLGINGSITLWSEVQGDFVFPTAQRCPREGEVSAEPQQPERPQPAARLRRSVALPNSAQCEKSICPGPGSFLELTPATGDGIDEAGALQIRTG